jgi:hypothetical protein
MATIFQISDAGFLVIALGWSRGAPLALVRKPGSGLGIAPFMRISRSDAVDESTPRESRGIDAAQARIPSAASIHAEAGAGSPSIADRRRRGEVGESFIVRAVRNGKLKGCRMWRLPRIADPAFERTGRPRPVAAAIQPVAMFPASRRSPRLGPRSSCSPRQGGCNHGVLNQLRCRRSPVGCCYPAGGLPLESSAREPQGDKS